FCDCVLIHMYFFFFSSRRRHTRSKRDWSSDVCSSDLTQQFIIIILLIALGYTLKRIKYFKANDSQVFSTLVLNVTLPSLVIVNLNGASLDLSRSEEHTSELQ